MCNAIIISGYLTNLSDNIIPFIKGNDVFVHTWDDNDNKRWINKLNRYKKYCNNLYVKVESPKFFKKLHSYFYSTYSAVNLIKHIDTYDKIIKFKPDLEGDIEYKGNITDYFDKAYIQTRPLLDKVSVDECIFGSIYYKAMDERIFTGYPLAFKKLFHIFKETFVSEIMSIDAICEKQYGKNYEGCLFWRKWMKSKNVFLIQDIDLKLPNKIYEQRN